MCEIDWNLLGTMLTGLGTLIIGIGTVAIGFGAIKSIPEELRKRSGPTVDPELIKRYRIFALRAISMVEVENMGLAGRTGFPDNFDTFLPKLIEAFPQFGTIEDIKIIINDLMKEGKIQYTTRLENNTPVLRTIYWDENGKRRIEQTALNEQSEILQ